MDEREITGRGSLTLRRIGRREQLKIVNRETGTQLFSFHPSTSEDEAAKLFDLFEEGFRCGQRNGHATGRKEAQAEFRKAIGLTE